MKFYKFSALLQNNGWMSPAFVGVDAVRIDPVPI